MKLSTPISISSLVFSTFLICLMNDAFSAPVSETQAQSTAWLHKMEQALDQQSFSGRFVHVAGNKVRSLQLLHTHINGDTYERLTHLDGPKIEIIRQGEKIYCYFPGHATLLLNQPAKPEARLNTSPVSRNLNLPIAAIEARYQLSQLAEDRIAGLAAIPIRLKPRDMHRYQYEFWLEANSGLLIKSSISNDKGEALENFEFTQLELNANLGPSDFNTEKSIANPPANNTPAINNKPTVNKSTHASTNNARSIAMRQAALPDWQVQWLPDGFVQTTMQIDSPQQPHNPLAMKLFTDGLATFSIFIESLPATSELLPSTTQGATLSTSRWLNEKDHRYAATLMGEIPMQSAKKIIDSIQLIASN